MLKVSEKPQPALAVNHNRPEPEEEQIRHATEELLHSPQLRTTMQCQHLLRYIIEHSLNGDPALLRERIIGKEVFGRRADYEPGEDPVVRIRAADLRKRLALYYQSSTEPPEVKIEIPSGSYRASFSFSGKHREENDRAVETAPALATIAAPEVPVGSPTSAEPNGRTSHRLAEPRLGGQRGRLVQILFALAFTLIVALLYAGWGFYGRATDTVRQFWLPMLAEKKPILISIGSNAVYRVGDRQIDSYISSRQLSSLAMDQDGMELFPPFKAEQSLASTGLYPAQDSFVALGDVAAASEFVKTFTHYGKDFEERFPNDISFAEVREHPTVLIGGGNNATTREVTRGVPFVRYGRTEIQDRDHPGRKWDLHASTDSHDTEDYAIITRLVATKDASPLVSVAGLGQYGTLAATDFLSRADSLAELRHALGEDWLRRNFQVILRTKIRDFKPVTSTIVDHRLW